MGSFAPPMPGVKPPDSLECTAKLARAHYRLLGQAELLSEIDVLAWDAADDDADSAAVAAALREPWLTAATEELRRRERLHQTSTGVPDPHDARYERWADLARDIRERVDLVAACEVELIPLKQTGRHEHHGPCPLCGGRDRFMVRTDPPFHRFWCRQCGTAGDAIALYRATHPDATFYDAVRFLAAGLGLPLPAEPERATPARVEPVDCERLRTELTAVTAERDALRRELDTLRDSSAGWYSERAGLARKVDQSAGVTAALARLESTSYKVEKPTALYLARAYGSAPPERQRGDGWVALPQQAAAADLSLSAPTVGRHLRKIAGVEVRVEAAPGVEPPDFRRETWVRIAGVPQQAIGKPEGIIAAANQLTAAAPDEPSPGHTWGGKRERRYCWGCQHDVDAIVTRTLTTVHTCPDCGRRLGKPTSVPYQSKAEDYGKLQVVAIDTLRETPPAEGAKNGVGTSIFHLESAMPTVGAASPACKDCGQPTGQPEYDLCTACWVKQNPWPGGDALAAAGGG